MSHNPDGHLKLHPGYSYCMAKPRRLPWILVLITLGVTVCIVISSPHKVSRPCVISTLKQSDKRKGEPCSDFGAWKVRVVISRPDF